MKSRFGIGIPIVTVLLLTVSCSRDTGNLCSYFESQNPGWIKRISLARQGVTGYASGIKLTFESSRFSYSTCGIMTKGKVIEEGDYVTLMHESIFREDSSIGLSAVTFDEFPFYQKPLVFRRQKGNLIAEFDDLLIELYCIR